MFNTQAATLFGQIAAHPGVGIRTGRIEDESRSKLQKAFEDTLRQVTGRRHWPSTSYALNRCMDAMEAFISMLELKLVTEDQRWTEHKKSIAGMYAGLAKVTGDLIWTRSALVSNTPRKLRFTARRVYSDQIRRHAESTRKAISQLLSLADLEILTDVLWLFDDLKSTSKDARLIFSSCDTGFVSSRGNRVIPSRILATFGIECEWPGPAAHLIHLSFASIA